MAKRKKKLYRKKKKKKSKRSVRLREIDRLNWKGVCVSICVVCCIKNETSLIV